MSNIIRSDFYRLRKGAALRNTIIGLLCVVIFIAFMLMLANSGKFGEMIEDTAGSNVDVEMVQDMQEIQGYSEEAVYNSASFGLEILGQNVIPIFFLPVIIAIFCADFSCQTYRNTLSYDSNRKKIYLSKLLLGIIVCFAITAITIAFSWIVGGILFGFGGFSSGYFAHIGIVLLLQTVVYVSLISFGFCMGSITRSSGATIAIYLIAMTTISVAAQLVVTFIPSMDWLYMIDWLSLVKSLAGYQMIPTIQLIIAMLLHVAVAVITTVIGVVRYCNTDFN